jgi:hypothetical protein
VVVASDRLMAQDFLVAFYLTLILSDRESAIQSLMFLARKRKNAQHQVRPYDLCPSILCMHACKSRVYDKSEFTDSARAQFVLGRISEFVVLSTYVTFGVFQFPPFVLKQLLERLCDEDSRVRSSAADGGIYMHPSIRPYEHCMPQPF